MTSRQPVLFCHKCKKRILRSKDNFVEQWDSEGMRAWHIDCSKAVAK